MSTAIPATSACPSCGSSIRQGAVYCRECGAMNLASTALLTPARPVAAAPGEPPLLSPMDRPRPSVAHADQAPVRRPRWILGTFWALVTIGALFAGIVGPAKWLLLVAIATGAYSVYLYRGGRYGFFIF